MTNSPETITIGDRIYSVLFPDLVRPLTDRERRDLKSSIEQFGIKQEVVVDEEGNGIIDGANRARIAAELGLPIPTRLVETKNDEEKRQLALQLNTHRRHLTPEERTKVIEARRQRVQESRAEGKSLRTIAEQEGVSEKQVRKDLAASPADLSAPDGAEQSPIENASETASVDTSPLDGSPNLMAVAAAPAPVTVRGRDGKTYSSQRGGQRKRGQKPKKCRIKGLLRPVKDEDDLLFSAAESLRIDRGAIALLSTTLNGRKRSPEFLQAILVPLRQARDDLDKIIKEAEGCANATA